MIIQRFAFWNPGTWQIPKLYWDAFSDEQRIHAICKQLGKVIAYADYLGINVDDIAERLKAIEEGQLDPIIIAAIEQWFEDNQPAIMLALQNLEEALPISDFDSVNTVKAALNAIEGRFPVDSADIADAAVTEAKIADDAVTGDKIADGAVDTVKLTPYVRIKLLSYPNFSIVDRYIFSDYVAGTSGQASCMFRRGSTYYSAQVVLAPTETLVIRNMTTNTTLSSTPMALGHGYSMSEKNNKLLISDSMDVYIIDISDLTAPAIETTYLGVNEYNVCWYKDHFAAAEIDGNDIVIKEYASDFASIIATHSIEASADPFVIQNICWSDDLECFIIGTTHPDGFFIVNTEQVLDYIKCQNYYGHVYMRELESAYALDSKIYINTFDYVDNKFVITTLEWDWSKGSVGQTESYNLFTNLQLSNFDVNGASGDLINPIDGNNFALVGDIINLCKAVGSKGNPQITLNADIDYAVINNLDVIITPSTDINIKWIYARDCTIRMSSLGRITFTEGYQISSSVKAGLYFSDGIFVITDNSYFVNPLAFNPLYTSHVLVFANRLASPTTVQGSLADSLVMTNISGFTGPYSSKLSVGSIS